MKNIFIIIFIVAIAGQLKAQVQGQERGDSLLTLLSKAKEDTNRVNILNELSLNYYSINPEKGILYGKQGLALAESLSWQKGIAYAHLTMGINFCVMSDYTSSLKHLLNALRITEALKDKYGKAKALVGIANVYTDQANYADGLKYDLQALKLREEIGDKRGIAGSLNNIGNQYYFQKDYPKSLEYYFKALKLNGETGNRDWEAINLSNIGEAYKAQFNYIKSLEYNFNALRINDELGIKSSKANNFGIIADTYLRLATDSNKAQLNMLFQGNKTAALQYAKLYSDSAMNLYKELDDVYYLKDVYKTLSETQALLGDNKGALESYKLYAAAKDSVLNIEKNKKLTQTSMQYEFDKKEAANKVRQDKKDTQQRLITLSVLIGLVVMLVFATVLFIQHNKVKKEKQNAIVAKQLAEAEQEKSEELLLNILPAEVAQELKATGAAKTKAFTMVTVMFTDFKDFTRVGEKVSAELLVDELHYCFSAFDRIIQKHKIEKIKTIGDAYLCASGLPVSNYTHAVDMVNAAIEIRSLIAARKKEKEAKGEIPFELRIGIHTGPVVAGIVGIKKYAYDIWGDTVNLAARMEQESEAGKINISGNTFELVKTIFNCEHRGKIFAKNKGEVDMYFVEV